MRDKILDGKLEPQDCDNIEVYQFLKLLISNQTNHSNRIFQPITIEDWSKEVSKAKKKSASSIFLKRTYVVYKCALDSTCMIGVLVAFYNILIKE